MNEKKIPWCERDDPRGEWDAGRSRPNEEKTVLYCCENNSGLPQNGKKHEDGNHYAEVTFVTGNCPCSECGHTEQWQCEDANCECCSETCT